MLRVAWESLLFYRTLPAQRRLPDRHCTPISVLIGRVTCRVNGKTGQRRQLCWCGEQWRRNHGGLKREVLNRLAQQTQQRETGHTKDQRAEQVTGFQEKKDSGNSGQQPNVCPGLHQNTA